jgi:hydroxymethylbilane synthase
MLPAAGQGAIAIETRAGDHATIEVVGKLNHEPTQIACIAERGFLRALGGGCQLPIASYARVSQAEISIEGLVADRQGREVIRDKLCGASADAERLGAQLAMRLLERGADKLLA